MHTFLDERMNLLLIHQSYFLADLLAVAQGLYAFNRFLASGLLMIRSIKPRILLLVYLVMCFVFAVAAMNTNGPTSIGLAIMIFCFESVRFILLFTKRIKRIRFDRIYATKFPTDPLHHQPLPLPMILTF